MKKSRTHDIETLPAWARRRIEKLEVDVSYWKTKAFEATGETDTDTAVRDLSGFPAEGDLLRGLPKGSEIVFTVASGHIDARVEHQRLRIRGDYGERIVVAPYDSSSVDVYVVRR